MKKLKLEYDDLVVDSFPTTTGWAGVRGTVRGKASEDTFCASDEGPSACNCGITDATCSNIHHTCQDTCNCGLTYTCITGGQTDCPGQTQCAAYTEDYTCAGSCTDQGCTACGFVC